MFLVFAHTTHPHTFNLGRSQIYSSNQSHRMPSSSPPIFSFPITTWSNCNTWNLTISPLESDPFSCAFWVSAQQALSKYTTMYVPLQMHEIYIWIYSKFRYQLEKSRRKSSERTPNWLRNNLEKLGFLHKMKLNCLTFLRLNFLKSGRN